MRSLPAGAGRLPGLVVGQAEADVAVVEGARTAGAACAPPSPCCDTSETSLKCSPVSQISGWWGIITLHISCSPHNPLVHLCKLSVLHFSRLPHVTGTGCQVMVHSVRNCPIQNGRRRDNDIK